MEYLTPKNLPTYETKPWEVKALDTKEIWQFGNNFGISSLDLMCVSMGIESPKTGEVSGNLVHDTYWNANGLGHQLQIIVKKMFNVFVELIKKFII
jgi:hypothetical protein